MIAGFPFIASSFDPDARAFVQTSGATDRAALNFFVKGIKRLGLWDDMVCWPLRSSQNAGTGSTAYSLGGLGTYNGTLINGPTWGEDGIAFSQDSSEHILTSLTPSSSVDQFVFAVFECNAQGAGTNFNVVVSSRNPISPAGGWTAAQEWAGGFGTLLWADAGSLNLLDINQIIDGSYNSALWRYSLSSSPQNIGITVNTLSEQSTSGARTQGASNPIVLGNEQPTSTRSLGGNLSFAAYITASSVNNAALRSLYKSTLGQGLSLP
jgi:hypothetical protein